MSSRMCPKTLPETSEVKSRIMDNASDSKRA